jgi:hypothetical protein
LVRRGLRPAGFAVLAEAFFALADVFRPHDFRQLGQAQAGHLRVDQHLSVEHPRQLPRRRGAGGGQHQVHLQDQRLVDLADHLGEARPAHPTPERHHPRPLVLRQPRHAVTQVPQKQLLVPIEQRVLVHKPLPANVLAPSRAPARRVTGR